MTTIAFDIEGDGLREVRIDKAGTVHDEVSVVHCICIRDVDTNEARWFGDILGFPNRSGNLLDGWHMLMSADLLIAHNGIDYDMPVLRRLIAPPGHVVGGEPRLLDTLVWSRFLYPDRKNHPNRRYGNKPNALETWGKKLRCKKLPTTGFDWTKLTKKMLMYCDQDVVVCIAIYRHLLSKMKRWKVHSRLEHEVARIIARQSCNGVGFDTESADHFDKNLLGWRAEVYDDLMRAFPPTVVDMKQAAYWYDSDTMVGYKRKGDAPTAAIHRRLMKGPVRFKLHQFNPGSDQQVAERLMEKHGWKPKDRTKPSTLYPKGQVKVDEAILSRLPWPEADLLNRHNMIEKRLSMLKDWMWRAQYSRDGRIHGSVNPLGTPTARMTHSQPNQTAVPKVKIDDTTGYPLLGYEGRYGFESRSLFMPREGWVQVGADASGLELRMLAHRTFPYDEGSYAKILIEHDVHIYNMEQIALLQTRPQSKETFYAGIYGAGAWKQGHTIINHKSLTPKQAARYDGMTPESVGAMFKEQLNDSIPALGRAINRCKQWCRSKGYLILLDGRHAPIRAEHIALNTQLQGDGSVICKLALVLSDRALRKRFGPPLMENEKGRWEWMINSHDETQVEADPEIAEGVGKIMAWSYAEAGRRLKCRVPTPGEYKVGANWAETH